MQQKYMPEMFEKKIYEMWKKNKYFSAKTTSLKEKFSMVMPPPNVTGNLHMGHALDNTMQDIIIRQKRMQGFETLWVPGTDHAAIATETKIVDKLATEGKTKDQVSREEFVKIGWDWYKKFGNIIINQLETLGLSPDWDRLAFTMDENLCKAVTHAFVHYYKKGWIYRGKRVTNWCTHCKSAISDMENEHEERNSFIWYIKYPLEDNTGYITVATTRPETMFGDTAVAVNPNDKRYKNIIGKNVILPFVNKKIPVIADDYVEINFGSGALKITPAHDGNDYEVGLRHNLEVVTCINDSGKITEIGGEFAGLDRDIAREKIVNKLKELLLLEKVEKYKHSVGICQRCQTVTEPRITTQWWVRMKELAQPAIDVLKKGELKFFPKRFEKQYLNWLLDIRDWCISRQLYLGHRIPAYYCECGEIIVSETNIENCPKCGGLVTQDNDVLDTWFSSALWPFSTLGYPNKTEDLKNFYPTNTLVTGYDIISFWITKMVYSGIEFMGKSPFKDVVIHGIVRDCKGIKMSKSLGNGIDPLDVIQKYGADSLRYSIIVGTGMGVDINFDEEKIKQAKIFINKLYNASKFVILNTSDLKPINLLEEILKNKSDLNYSEKWILFGINKLVKEVNRNFEKYQQGIALSKISNFFWGKFCDWFIELSKSSLINKESKLLTKYVLCYALDVLLKLFHPFIPFVTEEIYLNLPIHSKTIMLEKFPFEIKEFNFKQAKEFNEIIELIKAIRNMRAEFSIPDNKKIKLFIQILKNKKLFENCLTQIEKLALGSEINVVSQIENENDYFKVITENAVVFLLKDEISNKNSQNERLNDEIKKIDFEIARSEKMLSNQGFISKAPKELIEEEKEKLEKNKLIKERLLRTK